MKHSKKSKLLALVLVLCLSVTIITPASAAGFSSGRSSSFSWSSIWDRLFGGSIQLPSTPQTPSEPETGSDTSTESGSTGTSGGTMTLVEDETTVSEGTALRASTYTLTNTADSPSTYASNTTLKYFPVTLYNYDKATINNATHQKEVDAGLGDYWNGIYFNEGAPETSSYTYSTGGEVSYTSATVNYSKNNNYNTYINNGYYVDVNGAKYLVTGLSCTRSGSWWNGYTYSWTITYAGGTATSSDSSITLYKASTSSTATTDSLPYAPHNVWTNKIFDSDDTTANYTFGKLALRVNYPNHQVNDYDKRAGYIYSGLVQSKLDSNKNLVFNYPEGGIFNSDSTVKDIYTNVGLPFDFDGETYTFDAQSNASAEFSGDPASNMNLTKTDKGNFLPFGSTDWHFGMAATIPFTMTMDGKLSSTNQKDIVFNFAGDDDVWVFIDGVLVLDMGGIHNSVSGAINFAANTTSVSATTSSDGNGYINTTEGAVSGVISRQLFNDDNETGILNQSRETFAAADSHELSIFYLERGAGVSNCKIQFNLPMKDTVTVTKRATQSISSDGTLSPLTAKEQATVDNIDFGFTLTKNGAPVANANYSLLNANGQAIGTPSTDANGHFTLRNGQTAKFVGEIAADGAEYQVVEDAVDGIGFKLPTYTYSGTAAGGFTVSSTSYSKGSAIPATKENLTSSAITAKGSTEAEDSLQFICENYFDANLPNPSSRPVDDQIVIDYGLSVVIDALANDVYRGDTIELTDVTGAQYGTATIKNGKITYQLTKQLTNVEVLTYTAKVTGSGNEGTEATTASESKTAKIYIIPATSMYYEENFSDLVTFSDGWSDVGTAQTDPQEPGVVGTVGDSPYGSDGAYLNDRGDSNGSSMYVETTDGAAQFSYTFTGTGTSFFARTGATAAYMRVVVTDNETDKVVHSEYRNNVYKETEGTTFDGEWLYNIPVFTYTADAYGSYTVTVTIPKATPGLGYGKDFYLDGIRVVQPLNSVDTNVSIAESAYATDGEANMTVVTLREKLIGEAQINPDDTISWNEGDNFVLFTDNNGEIKTAEEYRSNGPKEEVYLNNSQSITFSLTNWNPNTNKVYLGIKAPTGSASVSVSGHTLNLENAADCYYDISGYGNITTDNSGVKTITFEVKSSSGLVSVTNIKVTGSADFTIVDQPDDVNIGGSEGGDIDASGSEGEDTDGGDDVIVD